MSISFIRRNPTEMIEERNITLRQGLERFYVEYKSHLSHKKEGIPNEVKSFFKSHDIAPLLAQASACAVKEVIEDRRKI